MIVDVYKRQPIGASALLRRNLLIYGIGGVIAPFVGIKLIDLVVGLSLIHIFFPLQEASSRRKDKKYSIFFMLISLSFVLVSAYL